MMPYIKCKNSFLYCFLNKLFIKIVYVIDCIKNKRLHNDTNGKTGYELYEDMVNGKYDEQVSKIEFLEKENKRLKEQIDVLQKKICTLC